MCLYLYFFRLQVVIDAFRLINPNMMVLGQESRQTTSNLGHLQKPSIQVYLLKIREVDEMLGIRVHEHLHGLTHVPFVSFVGSDTWSEQTLLLNLYQLQKE